MGRVISEPCKPQPELERKILEVIGKESEKEVLRACEKWNARLRGYLRNVTGLRLTTETEKQSVPVKVVSGIPGAFASILDEERASLSWWLMGHRRGLTNASVVLQEVLDNYPEIQWIVYDGGLPPATKKDIYAVLKVIADILSWRKGKDWLYRLREINEDVFGAYFYRMPIALMAKRLDVSAEAVTVVVLTHELAHAYTHLGFDTDGDSWDTDSFARASDFIVEGLAQFYTDKILEEMASKDSSPQTGFNRLINYQSPSYTDYQSWLKGHSRIHEVVRLGMIEVRVKSIGNYGDFKQELEKAAEHLPHDPSYIPGPCWNSGEEWED